MTFSYTMHRQVLFNETDASSLLHFTNTLRYMEDCEHAFLREMGIVVYDPTGQDTSAWPRVEVSCKYFSPLQFDDEVTVRLLIKSIGRSSLTYQFQLRRTNDEELCAIGHMVTVYVDRHQEGALSPRELPLDLLQQITSAPDRELWHA